MPLELRITALRKKLLSVFYVFFLGGGGEVVPSTQILEDLNDFPLQIYWSSV